MRAVILITVILCFLSPGLTQAEPSEKPRQPGNRADVTFTPPPGVGHLSIRKMVSADGVMTEVNEDGREITITENDDGISVTINDKGQTREATSKDPAALEQEHPEAFELYQRYIKDADGAGQIRIAGGVNLVLGPMNQRADGLGVRLMLVADPFVLAQLGQGVSIARVYDDTRASRIGLRQYDYLRAVNGKPVTTVQEAIEAIKEFEGGRFTLEITRGGERMTLSEE